jgi:MFS family permease
VRPPLIALLCVYGFAVTVSQGAFPALLPEIGTTLGLADWQLGVVAGAFGLARLVANVPIGLVITHHLRAVLVAGPLLNVAGILAVASGGPLPLLVAGRVVMGLGQALTVVGGLTAILRYRPASVLASSLSAFELSAMLGLLVGTATLGLLPARLSWNVAFVLTCLPLIVGFIALRVLLATLPRESRAARPLFERPAPLPGGAGTSALVSLAFAAGAATALTYATLEHFVIPLRGSRELGLDRRGIANLLAVVQVADIACLLPVGALGDRFGARRVLGSMMLVFAAGAVLIAFGDLALLVVGCALFGSGMAAWTLPLALVRAETPPERVGWRTALYRLGVDGGMTVGPLLSGVLAARWPWLLPSAGAAALLALGSALLASPRARRAGLRVPVVSGEALRPRPPAGEAARPSDG